MSTNMMSPPPVPALPLNYKSELAAILPPNDAASSSSPSPPNPPQRTKPNESIDVHQMAKYYFGKVVYVWTDTHVTIKTNEAVFDKLYLHSLNRNVNGDHVNKLKSALYATQGHAQADPLDVTVSLLMEDYRASLEDNTIDCQLAVLDGQHRVTAAREMIATSRKTPGARPFNFTVRLTLFICENEDELIQRIERINFQRPYDALDGEHVRVRNMFLDALHTLVGEKNKRRRAVQLLTRSPKLRDETWTRKLLSRSTPWIISKIREISKETEYSTLAREVSSNSALGKLIHSSQLLVLADTDNAWLDKLAQCPETPVDVRRKTKVRKLEE